MKEKQTEQIIIKCSPEEKLLIRKKAGELNLSIKDFILLTVKGKLNNER